ncbi:MAG: hypothetical protein JSU05_02840 [Bacteroidetes bacterium]|nr:hypothetical protein [Bacteroidota bacterium]
MNKYTLFLVIVLVLPEFIWSQKKEDTNSHLQTGLTYLDNNVYLGRQDSVPLPYITPAIGYYNKSGFYLSAAVSYAAISQGQVDLATIEAGYDHKWNDKFDGGAYLDKYLFSGNSFAIRSEMNTGAGIYGTYDLGLLSLDAGAGISWSNTADFNLEAGMAHSFSFMEDRLSLEPGLKMNAGTRNFYKQYYKAGRQHKIKKSGNTNSTSSSGTIIVETTGLAIMDYELTCPLTYETKKWKLVGTPVYAIPVNPAKLLDGSSLRKEKLADIFYGSIEIDYKFSL